MKKPLILTLLTLAMALPSLAEDNRHQSYVSYDDGGAVVRSGEDGRQIDVHRNLPIYPGDEVITARRGRAEVRLSDGNIIGIDRTTAIRFRSVLDAYEGDSDETVAELRYGKVAVHRTDLGRDHVRLDTNNASYVAEREAIYSVETDQNGRDRVTVFEGSVEVRTPSRATRLRAGDSASVDDQGAFDLIGDQRGSADDFERWFLRRAERFDGYNSRYVDRRLGYWADDLDENGRWVFVTGIGWSWRPYVSVGWRPYYNGYWHHSRWGGLTWVSYDPWGWGTYHYGRWAYDPGYGWVWVPGYGYSPAWVYWTYGPNYIGWAPAGWWECYRPYYNWAYHPYRSRYHNFGFYGRVRVNEFDLRPWTFVDSGTLVSNRIDRAALTTDIIKQRLSRTPDGFATISGGAARFTREELRDPADAIRRRGLDGRLTGRETGAPATDLTPFVRRENEIGGTIRDRIVRSRGGSGDLASGGSGGTPSRSGSIGGVAPIAGGNTAPIGRGGLAPINGGSVAPITGGSRSGGADSGRITRGATPRNEEPAATPTPSNRGTWRDRLGDRRSDPPATTDPGNVTAPPSDNSRSNRGDSWRSRARGSEPKESGSGSSSSGSVDRGSSDVPRRVIDRIGGARVVPRDSGSSRDTSTRSSGSRNSGSRSSGSVNRGSGSGSRSSGSGGSVNRDSGSRSSGSGSSSASGSSRSSGGSGSRESGGRIKRD